MPPAQHLKYIVPMAIAALAFSWWRYRTARGIAEDWLLKNRYRVRTLRMGWHLLPRFAGRFGRSYEHSYEFRAEVDDRRLGGTGVLWLRVWTDWMGMMQKEPEQSWERMPVVTDASSRTAEDKWAEAQLALLERISRGESTFRSPVRNDAESDAFDEVVEHVMALQRRGLVSADAPVSNYRGTSQFDLVSNVAITNAGRQMLESHERTRNEQDAAARRSRRAQG